MVFISYRVYVNELAMPVNVRDEAELVMLLQEKSFKAFDYLYDAYAPALYGCLQKIIACPSTAQDILQNAFVKIWSNTAQYNASKGRLFTWMINITRYEALDYLRSKQHRQSTLTEMGIKESIDNGNACDRYQIRFDVRRLIGQLPLKERSIIELSLAGFTCREIGQLFGLPEGTVKTKMRTAYRKLRLALQN